MKTTRITPNNRAGLTARFLAHARNARKAGAFAVLSVSTLKAVSTIEAREADRLSRQIVSQARTDDAITDQETAGTLARVSLYAESTPTRHALSGYLLSPAERNEVGAGSAFVMRKTAVVRDELLPPGYVAAPVADYRPILTDTLTAEESAQLAAEARAEVAAIEERDQVLANAVDFASDLDSGIVDYAPRVPRVAVRHINRVAQQRDPIGEHAQLLAAILGNARPARRVHHAL